MGLFMFMNVPGLQLYAVILSEKYVPSAIAMAAALNISAFNIGIFLGSYIGGFIIRHQSLAHTPLYGFLMVMLAALVTLLWLLFDKRKKIVNVLSLLKEVEFAKEIDDVLTDMAK